MVRHGILLLLLLIPGISNAQSCYCTTPWITNPNTGASYCTANTDCWACAPGAYDPNWQSLFCSGYVPPAPVVSCNTQTIREERSCQANYSGSKTYEKQITSCTDGRVTETAWAQVSDNCVANPPTCVASSESQTLACQSGYTGSLLQSRSSSCSDPYGQPVWSGWMTVSDQCVKSLTNPTNVASPVSPINPASPMNQEPAPLPPPPPAAPVDVAMPAPEVKQETKQDAKQESNAGQGLKPRVGGLGLALSLELIVKPGIQQPSVFPSLQMNQELPSDYGFTQNFFLDLITGGDIGRAFNDIAGDRWGSLYGHNPIQSGGLGD